MQKSGGSFEIFLLKNSWTRRAYIYMITFWYIQDCSSHGSRGLKGQQWRKTYWHVLILTKHLQNQQAKFNQTWYKSSLGKEIQNCTDEGPCPLQREDNYKNEVESFKNLHCKKQWTRIAHIYMKAFWYNVALNLLRSWSLGVGRDHNSENICKCLYLKITFSSEPTSKYQLNLVQIILE
jgi:hypothetical protein